MAMAERKEFETPSDPAGSRTQLPHSSAGGRLPSQGQIMSQHRQAACSSDEHRARHEDDMSEIK